MSIKIAETKGEHPPAGTYAVVEMSLWLDVIAALQAYPQAHVFIGRDINYTSLKISFEESAPADPGAQP